MTAGIVGAGLLIAGLISAALIAGAGSISSNINAVFQFIVDTLAS